MVRFGMIVHILGIAGDSSFAARVYVKKTQWFRLAALIAVSLYTILWLGWLIWLHIVVFNHKGRVCSGSYLSDSKTDGVDYIPGYAIQQGRVLTNIIIGVWCANGAIAILNVIATVIGAQYLKRKATELTAGS